METYLGRRSGARVLAGAVQRGDGETINAVLWCSDLRDFTALSESLPRDRVIALLNAHFERLAAPIKAFGGEVLKFMGDGLLAIFPTEAAGASAGVRSGAQGRARRARRHGGAERRAQGQRRKPARVRPGAASRRRHVRQYRRARPARLHGDRPDRQPRQPARGAVQAARLSGAGFGRVRRGMQRAARGARQLSAARDRRSRQKSSPWPNYAPPDRSPASANRLALGGSPGQARGKRAARESLLLAAIEVAQHHLVGGQLVLAEQHGKARMLRAARFRRWPSLPRNPNSTCVAAPAQLLGELERRQLDAIADRHDRDRTRQRRRLVQQHRQALDAGRPADAGRVRARPSPRPARRSGRPRSPHPARRACRS